jgi:hypothetical protein
LNAVVRAASESAMEVSMAGPASGVAGSSGSETPVVGTADGGALVDGATVVEGIPVVAMKSSTRLLRMDRLNADLEAFFRA